MGSESHRGEPPGPLGFAIVTVSDSRTAATDRGGPAARTLVERAGHAVVLTDLVPDEPGRIREAVEAALALAGCDVVVVTGGTGLSPRDLTIEALAPLFEREIPGFGELFRALSFAEVGAAAMLSRAAAGIRAGRAVFLVPGSPSAVALAMERLVLPEAAHLVAQLRR
jgi:molybdenum cofactor biosynthesis protein B